EILRILFLISIPTQTRSWAVMAPVASFASKAGRLGAATISQLFHGSKTVPGTSQAAKSITLDCLADVNEIRN
ncbi:MAG: hypothetical protein ACI9NC_000992, partial [Verrucomicrobiales bacterium]